MELSGQVHIVILFSLREELPATAGEEVGSRLCLGDTDISTVGI
jgi:hypothetical protein